MTGINWHCSWRLGGWPGITLGAQRGHRVLHARVGDLAVRIGINKLTAGGLQELPAIAATFTQLQDVHAGPESLGLNHLAIEQAREGLDR